jgi:hypothetical protein
MKTKRNWTQSLGMAVALASGVLSASSYAVEGYQDHYLDREQDIFIQGILCGDFNNPRSLKPSGVYTNSGTIETGTYYFGSKYGNYSYTLAPVDGQPDHIMKRGLLMEGQTDKSQMKKDLCIVKDVPSLPAQLRRNLSTTHLKANDANWDKTMDQYAMVTGRPAFAPGNYENPRATAKNDSHDQAVYEANQAYLSAAKVHFEDEAKRMAKQLPKKVADAVKYAHQEDGFLKTKVYRKVEKPLVWTPVAERRYNDQLRQLNTEKAFDRVIQENFDWLFRLIGKGTQVESVSVDMNQQSQWNGQVLNKTVVAKAQLDNGKMLELDFVYESEKVDAEIFDTLAVIKEKSNRERNSMIVKAKKDRPLVDSASAQSLDVYSPTEKVHLFFSPFRNKSLGDSYRYQ